MEFKRGRLNPVNFGETPWEFRVGRGGPRARYYGHFVRESHEHVCAPHEPAVVPEVTCTFTIHCIQLAVPFRGTSFPI